MIFVRRALRVLLLLRLKNTLLPILAITTGFLAVQADTVVDLIIACGLFVTIHSIVTLWNDIEDEAIDVRNGRYGIHILRKLGHIRDAYVCLAFLAGIAVILVFVSTIFTVLWGLLFMLLGWLYNAGPYRLSRRPIASIVTMWLAYGVIPLGIGVSLGELSTVVFVLIVSWSLVRLSLSILKDFKDAKGDAASNKKTFLLVYGSKRVILISMIFAIIGLLGVASTIYLLTERPESVIVFILAGWLIYERSKLLSVVNYADKDAIFHKGLRHQILFDGAVITCLII